ncbi:MAG: hypothetical protein ACOCXH_13950 [Cyclobacteriaceae bacterium]
MPLQLSEKLMADSQEDNCPYFAAKSRTTDAPYRETLSAIESMKKENVSCVEMEAAALYAFATVKQKDVLCFAHLTNSMAQIEGDLKRASILAV